MVLTSDTYSIQYFEIPFIVKHSMSEGNSPRGSATTPINDPAETAEPLRLDLLVENRNELVDLVSTKVKHCIGEGVEHLIGFAKLDRQMQSHDPMEGAVQSHPSHS